MFLPFAVKMKRLLAWRSNPSATNSLACSGKDSSSDARTPSRVRSESAIRSLRFICRVKVSLDPIADWPDKTRSERSEEHTSELQSPYVISYAVFCLKKI